MLFSHPYYHYHHQRTSIGRNSVGILYVSYGRRIYQNNNLLINCTIYANIIDVSDPQSEGFGI
jgi:hypothetical protein